MPSYRRKSTGFNCSIKKHSLLHMSLITVLSNCAEIHSITTKFILLPHTKTYIHYLQIYMLRDHIYYMHVCLRWFSQTIEGDQRGKNKCNEAGKRKHRQKKEAKEEGTEKGRERKNLKFQPPPPRCFLASFY